MNKSVLNIILFFLFAYSSLKAQQNLVPNGSFEEYYDCPNSVGAVGNNQLEKCKFWYKPSDATSDYYNSCQTDITTGVNIPSNWFGWQQAYDGTGYVGLTIYVEEGIENCEYIQVRLTKPLKACEKYHVGFRVSLGDYCSRATNTLGLRLDKTPIFQMQPFNFSGFELPPHIFSESVITDTLNWKLISGDFIAEGGEEYLTIGRFLDTNYFSNYNVPNMTVDCDTCFPWEHSAHYYVDSVSVLEILNNDQNNINIPNVLTADADGINDVWFPQGLCFNNWNCEIINRWGEVVYKFKEQDSGWYGKDEAGKELTEGGYYYRIYSQNQIETGFIQLIR